MRSSARLVDLPSGARPLASIRRRTAAGLIDAACFLGVPAMVLGAFGVWIWRHPSPPLEDQMPHGQPAATATDVRGIDRLTDSPRLERLIESRWFEWPWLRRGLILIQLVLAVRGRGFRGPGERIMRTRRVELATGRPPAARTALIEALANQVSGLILNRLGAPLDRRTAAGRAATEPQLAELRRKHAGDRDALHQATTELYRQSDFNPLAGCAWKLALVVAYHQLPVIISPLNQSVAERIAGTVWIVEDPETQLTR